MMKVSAVSGDLLVKLAVGAAAVAALVYVARKAKTAITDNLPSLDTVNPASPDNVAYQTVNKVGGSLVGDTGPGKNADGSWTLGGWIYDVTHGTPTP